MTNQVPSWIPIIVKSFALVENVSSCFDGIKPAWITKLFPREKPKSVFVCWGMVGNCPYGSRTQRVRMAEEF